MKRTRRIDGVWMLHTENANEWTCMIGHTDGHLRTYTPSADAHVLMVTAMEHLCYADPPFEWKAFPSVAGWRAFPCFPSRWRP